MFLKNRDLLTFVLSIAVLSSCGGDDKKKSEDDTVRTTSSSVCRRICEQSAAADCANDPSDCASECESLIKESPARCARQLDALTSCAEKATYTCNADGESEAKPCAKQLTAWASCSGLDDESDDSGSGESGDEGVTGIRDAGVAAEPDAAVSTVPTRPTRPAPATETGASFCAASPTDSACDTCAKSECCAQLSACGADCTKRLSCVSACTTQECGEKCLAGADATAMQETLSVVTCLAESCDAACTTGASPESNLPPTTELPTDCSPAGSVPDGQCNVPDKPNAYACKKPPFDDCVASPTGGPGIFCCRE